MKRNSPQSVKTQKRSATTTNDSYETTSWSRRRKRGVRHKKPFNWKQFFAKTWRCTRLIFSISVLVSIFVVPLWGWFYLTENNVFKIEKVIVHSDEKYLVGDRKEQLIDELLGHNLVGYDFDHYHGLLSQNPWVKKAEITRTWPDRIDLIIEERQPIAIWNDLYLIEADGSVFEPDLMPPDIIISLQGNLDQREKILTGKKKVEHYIQSIGLNVEKIILDYRGAWTIILENDVELYLGARLFEDRLKRFVMHYPSSIRSKMDNIVAIDFRYDHGYALKWKR